MFSGAFRVAAGLALALQFPGMNVAEPSQASDARIELSFDKPSYVLGEPVLLHFCIVNVSNRPFDVEIGGDYRGGSRSTRFKVSVTNGAGVAMPDPDPSGFNLGGASTVRQVAPAGRECRSLLLMRYARIDEPGTFSIRATHDLGWKTSTPPGGTTTIALTMPGAEEANRVLDATLALPDLEDYAPGTMDVVEASPRLFGRSAIPSISHRSSGSPKAATWRRSPVSDSIPDGRGDACARRPS